MPRYFFDITNGHPGRDDTGTECASDDEMRVMAKQTLFDMAREKVPADSERCFFSLVVRDETDAPVYVATVSCAGLYLKERP